MTPLIVAAPALLKNMAGAAVSLERPLAVKNCIGVVNSATPAGSGVAVMPEVGHRIGERLECVVQPTEAIKAK